MLDLVRAVGGLGVKSSACSLYAVAVKIGIYSNMEFTKFSLIYSSVVVGGTPLKVFIYINNGSKIDFINITEKS